MHMSDRLNPFSKYLLRTHGTLDIGVGLALSFAAWNGYSEGIGPLAMLREQPMGFAGLFQAYTFMSCFGILLWIGSYQSDRRLWHLAGFLAHVVPFFGNIAMWDLMDRYRLGHGSLVFHAVFFIVEPTMFVLLGKARGDSDRSKPSKRSGQ